MNEEKLENVKKICLFLVENCISMILFSFQNITKFGKIF